MADAPEYYDLRRMTSVEVGQALPDIGCVIIPVGSTECHGPNIALASDAGQADAYAHLIAQRMHPLLAVAPPVNYGCSEHHMHFPGTATLSHNTFITACVEIATSFLRHGIFRVFFMNGHGGNTAPLSLVCDQLHTEHGIQAAHVVCGALGAREQGPEIYQGHDVGHACEFEVSNAMYLCPELVRDAALEKGDFVPSPLRHTRGRHDHIEYAYYWEHRTRNAVLGDAAKGASRDAGEAIVTRGLHILTEFFTDFCQLPRASREAGALETPHPPAPTP